MAAEWTPHSCEICINLDPIKVETPMSCSKKKLYSIVIFAEL